MANKLVKSLLFEECNSISEIYKLINSMTDSKLASTDAVTSSLIEKEFLEEIKDTLNRGITIYFGKTLKDLKCTVQDSSGFRDHEIYFTYVSPNRLQIAIICLPHSQLQDREFTSIEEMVTTVRNHLDRLSNYFYELELIDQNCSVMEPANPTFMDDYRRIFLDDRTWLHIEVTPDGLSTNVHLVGESRMWLNKLNAGLLTWDHDKSIVDNVMSMFDLSSFPVPHIKTSGVLSQEHESQKIMCGICLCDELPDKQGLPQPLCQNKTCGVHYHRDCLFEWLVACAGGRPPAFGVAIGSCPTCLQAITCAEKDG